MSTTITICDATTQNWGKNDTVFNLCFAQETITVRDLIRQRVQTEVTSYNKNQPANFKGLVQPADAERTLNGFKLRRPRLIDWKVQADEAVEAFEASRFFILVDDYQVSHLDDNLAITDNTVVTFLKLVPLVGG